MCIPLFWGGLNACPDGLGHLFTATKVRFSNCLKLVPEYPVEFGGVGQILFGQCPNVGLNNGYGSSLIPLKITFNKRAPGNV
jgi:hypothetical protein